MSTRSGRIRVSAVTSPPQTRNSRSPARARKISPAPKSPPAHQTLRKSPARKSPGRKTPSKYPARKSPARTKDVPDPTPAPPKSPTKRLAPKSNLTSEVSVRLETIPFTRSRRTEYTVQDIRTQSEHSIDKVNGIEPLKNRFYEGLYDLKNRQSSGDILLRRSSRLKEYDMIQETDNTDSDFRHSISKSTNQSKSISKSVSLGGYSDDENGEIYFREKSKSVTRKLSTPLRQSISNMTAIANRYEFGGRVGSAALILLMPLTVLTILTSCLKSCSYSILLNYSPFKSLKIWFSIPATVAVITQIGLQAIFTVLPILGPKRDNMDGGGTKYCFNAISSAVFTISLLIGMHLYGTIVIASFLNEYIKLATVSYIFAVSLSLILYVKSKHLKKEGNLNPYGNTGYFVYDFFIGREIHPKFKDLNIKIWISRICNINVLILSGYIISRGITLQWKNLEKITFEHYNELLNEVQLQPTILVFSMMQLLYSLSFIIWEYRVTSTFYWQSEGVGYMQTVSSALYPFYFTTLAKYVADSNISLSTNILILASLLFLLGYCIMLVSNSIKYEFRRNPLQPGFANLEIMPTYHGNKLLVSGLWGILRHPNYTGDILIHIALSLPGILTGQVIAASPALLTILVLLHRAWRDDARCKRRYGAAWSRYCKKVPKVIIPKIM